MVPGTKYLQIKVLHNVKWKKNCPTVPNHFVVAINQQWSISLRGHIFETRGNLCSTTFPTYTYSWLEHQCCCNKQWDELAANCTITWEERQFCCYVPVLMLPCSTFSCSSGSKACHSMLETETWCASSELFRVGALVLLHNRPREWPEL